jgi:hypothetical protein
VFAVLAAVNLGLAVVWGQETISRRP